MSFKNISSRLTRNTHSKQIKLCLKSVLITLLISSIYGCKCDDKPFNNVRVRIQNNLDVDINSALIGGTMFKSTDSFASCSMTEGFKDIKSGETTLYTQTHGNHLGYKSVRIDWDNGDRQGALSATSTNKEIMESELLRNGAVEDSVANVYNGNVTYGLRLPDGDYTFILKGFTVAQNPQIDVEIVRD